MTRTCPGSSAQACLCQLGCTYAIRTTSHEHWACSRRMDNQRHLDATSPRAWAGRWPGTAPAGTQRRATMGRDGALQRYGFPPPGCQDASLTAHSGVSVHRVFTSRSSAHCNLLLSHSPSEVQFHLIRTAPQRSIFPVVRTAYMMIE